MRLLFVSHSLPPIGRPLDNVGGMQRVATELDAALSSDDQIEYSRLVLRSTWKGIHRRTVPFLARSYRTIRRKALAGEIDVVLFSSMVTASLAVPLRKVLARSGVRTAAIVHGLDVTTPFGPYQRFVPRVFDALDVVMPVSAATGEACVSRGLAPDRVHVVRNGVDVDRFPPVITSRAQRRAELAPLEDLDAGLPEDAMVLVSVGRQVPRKGFEWFVRSVLPNLPPHVHYWLAGTGPEHDAILRSVQDTGLESRVRLLGRVSEDDLQRLYRGADLFVMPNVRVPGDMEGFGVVMLEAGLNGLPTVGAGIEGIAEVITNGQNGQLVASRDADAFVRAIVPFTNDRAGLAAASQRAHDFTRSQFSWSSVAAEYVGALEALIQRRSQ